LSKYCRLFFTKIKYSIYTDVEILKKVLIDTHLYDVFPEYKGKSKSIFITSKGDFLEIKIKYSKSFPVYTMYSDIRSGLTNSISVLIDMHTQVPSLVKPKHVNLVDKILTLAHIRSNSI
jgi:hypothetical protein